MTDLERQLPTLFEQLTPEPPRLLDIDEVRHRRPQTRRGTLVLAVAAAVVAATALPLLLVGRDTHKLALQPGSADRWSQPVRLDGGRLQINPPTANDTSSRKRSTVVQLLLSGSQNHTPTIAVRQVKYGRVTVYDAQHRIVAGFDQRPAWTAVYYPGPGTTNCPNVVARTPVATPPPGTFEHAQVFILADDGTALQYSQPAAWFCGNPTEPTVLPVLQRLSVPWQNGSKPGAVLASIPDCVTQPQPPLPVQRTVNGKQVLAIYAFAPFTPERCTSSKPRELAFSPGHLAHAPTVPVDCTRLTGQQPEFPPPDGCTLVGHS